MHIPKQQAYWARVHENVVTHLVNSTDNWVLLNPWPTIPGEWIQVDSTVKGGWLYDPETGTFTPPVLNT
jgi:hypothetical protein